MSAGTLTFTECPDGTVNVKVDFGQGGFDAESPAHFLLLTAMTATKNAHVPADDEDTE